MNDCGDLHISKSCYRSTVTCLELIDVIRRDTKSQCRSFPVEVNGAERRTEAPKSFDQPEAVWNGIFHNRFLV
jgi:hypothetical protein